MMIETVPLVRRWRAFAVLAVAYFMTIVDLTIVNVSLPTIGRALKPVINFGDPPPRPRQALSRWAILTGENDYTTGIFEHITGRPPRPVAEFLYEHRAEFI